MQDLSVLTPPLLMCAVVLIAIVAFLRHEMGKKAPDDSEPPDDIPPVPPISDHQADGEATGTGPGHGTRDG
jgi:hypothetical protein